MKRLLFLLCLVNVTAFAYANSSSTGDSLKVMTHKDSILVRLDANQQCWYEHIVEKKQTLYSVLKFYGLSEIEFYNNNPKYKNLPFGIGDTLKIHLPTKAIMPTQTLPNWKVAKVYYDVQAGDNLFKIAHTIFNIPTDTIAKRNQLAGGVVKVGQRLHIGWLDLAGIPDTLRTMKAGLISSPIVKKTMLLQDKFMEQISEHKAFVEQGIALWNKQDKKTKDLFALHNTAALNSIIAVYNPMKRRTVFVKVIGRIPGTYPPDTRIILSPAVAKLLGARDPKFFVKTKYIMQ